jgi:Protein of unknown function (DUF2914)
MKALAKSDNALWLSRVSFLVSAIALVSVGYRSISKRIQTDAEARVAAGVASASKPASLLGFVKSTGLSKPGFVFSGLTSNQDVPSLDGVEVSANSSKPALESGETFRASIKAQAANIGVRVKRLVVTQAVEDREPVKVGEVSASTPVIAFVEVATDGREDQNVVVTFEHETGDRVGLVNLNVPGNKSRWRTWGRTYDVNRDGRWTAVVRDSRGEELGRTAFTVRGTS